ncbi:MAG: iron ABC transporter permease [Gemmatimonadaceae bacterium]|nr:iron ABC transporter permease [Gemmatimonadaceae bacterium]
MNRSRAGIWVFVTLTVVALMLAGIILGTIPIRASDALSALFGSGDPTTVAIVQTLRFPRVVMGVLVGAGLAMSGAALQGTLRNPLAEPYLLGVSGGAAVGAVLAFAVGASDPRAVALAAFVGATSAVLLALLVARAARSTRGDPRTLLMAGVIIGAFANAVIMVILANAPPNTIRGALWWMMGSLSDSDWPAIKWLAMYLVVGGGALIIYAREIDLLALGEEAAAALGVNVDRAAQRAFLLAALVAAATVAAAGLIGFVGLIVPHIVRALGVTRHRPLVLGSALVGAGLVVAADIVARTLLPPGELPLGAITALLGVPFFLGQLRKIT